MKVGLISITLMLSISFLNIAFAEIIKQIDREVKGINIVAHTNTNTYVTNIYATNTRNYDQCLEYTFESFTHPVKNVFEAKTYKLIKIGEQVRIASYELDWSKINNTSIDNFGVEVSYRATKYSQYCPELKYFLTQQDNHNKKTITESLKRSNISDISYITGHLSEFTENLIRNELYIVGLKNGDQLLISPDGNYYIYIDDKYIQRELLEYTAKTLYPNDEDKQSNYSSSHLRKYFKLTGIDKSVYIMRQTLKDLGEKIESIQPTVMPGIFKVIALPEVYYTSKKGNYAYLGSMIDTRNNIDLTVVDYNKYNKLLLQKMKSESIIVYNSTNTKKYSVTAFIEPDEKYSKKLYENIMGYNDFGIEVRVAITSRSKKNTTTYQKSIAIMCADDKKLALDWAMKGATLTKLKSLNSYKKDSCENNIYSFKKNGLLYKFSVNAVPLIYLNDGTYFKGYMPPVNLIDELEAIFSTSH